MAIKSNKEKKLIIARYFIKEKDKGNKFDEQDIFYMWNNYFPSDFRISKTRKLKIVCYGNYYKLEPKENWPDVKKEDINSFNNRFEKISKWIIRYVNMNNLDKVTTDILRQRIHQLKVLRKYYKPMNYSVVLPEKAACNTKYLAQYLLFDNGFQKSGYFTKLMDNVVPLQKEYENAKTN
ncbi:MAG: hypothetical protein Q4F11_10090 [Eubacteriales bacterium]|nr:hypothetical protein [Eubacteriales bacterium]